MGEEARVHADPALRADRFKERWRALEAEGGGAGRTAGQAEMIDWMRHDPALRNELERRATKLELDRDRQQMADQMRQRQIEIDPARSAAGSRVRAVKAG